MEGVGGYPSAAPAPPPLHPAIAPLSFLLGKWRGQGEGGFPTINSFAYAEELLFSHSGKPVIAYNQKTWKLASGEPMHAESGYWRPKADGSIEVVIAQSTGLVEVQVLEDGLQWMETCRRHLIRDYILNKSLASDQKVCHGDIPRHGTTTLKGSYDAENKIVMLQSELVGNASKVKEITRAFKVVNDELSYVVQMATSITSLQPHLKALLRKV